MNTPLKLGAFGTALAAVFATAYGVGGAVGPDTAPAPAEHAAAHDSDRDPGATSPAGETSGGETPGGLQVSERGYTLSLERQRIAPGHVEPFRFRVLGPGGKAVTAYEKAHDKELHLIVARRDLSGFQHVHPTRDASGVWSVPLKLPAAGDYRVFADFVPAGDKAGGLTLGADLAATGEYRPRPLPAPARTATVDGYHVTLTGSLSSGASSKLTLSIARDGRPVTDLQPYLGAYGHLVALRSGDLAYLHVHPDAEGPSAKPGPAIAFHVEAPSNGTYRLYLDFKHGGKVHTAEFTATTGPASGSAGGEHGEGGEHGDGSEHGGH